jgi:hypothetical protein
MKKYYLHNGSNQDGPFDISELKSKGITHKTQVWYEGITDWRDADQIEELIPLFSKATPPPFKTESNNQNTSTKTATKKGKVGNIIFKGILLAILGVFVLLAILVYIDETTRPSPKSYIEQKMTIKEIENANPTSFLSAEGRYNSSFWGTELKIRGDIRNDATVAEYKDVVLLITYYSKTKSVLGTNEYTLYEEYKPSSVTPFRLNIANYKDVDAINWKVVRALQNN